MLKADTPRNPLSPRWDAGSVPQKVASTELLRLGRELVILHNGREYRLRLTQNGKLILTA